jgi:superfamily I DNA/RNA helicase
MHVTKIYGPPGTGKTTRLLSILDDELKAGTDPRRIAYVTFSVAARLEAKQRVLDKFPHINEDTLIYFKTIHGICYAEIGMGRANVMQMDDYLKFAKYCPVEFSDAFTDQMDIDGMPFGWVTSAGNQIMNIRQVAAARRLDPFHPDVVRLDWPRDMKRSEVAHVLQAYGRFKEEYSKFDFVDMLHMYEQSGEALPIDVIIVDEAQDLSRLQWALVRKMCRNAKRMYLAGDDDQSIYAFLGADPYGFFHHPCDTKVNLSRTYRLRSTVWEAARKIIERVKMREPKQVIPRDHGGSVNYWGLPADAVLDRVPLEDVMVIGSTNYQLAEMKARLDQAGIPVNYRGTCVTQTQEAARFYWYHQLRKGKSVPIREAAAILKVLNMPQHKSMTERARLEPGLQVSPGEMTEFGVKIIPNRTMCDYLANKQRHVRANQALYQIASKFGLDASIAKPKVTLTTYHGSKGREAKQTILVTDCSPSAMEYAGRDQDYERRVAYVGLTRALETVNICRPQTDSYMKAFR